VLLIASGTVLAGKYKIIKVIGKGGMSVVYLAKDLKHNKMWAIKETDICLQRNREMLKESLKVEMTILKKANHPGLPKVVDVIYEEKTVYVIMDYIEGRPLSKVIKEAGPQPLDIVLGWGLQLCDVLGYLHGLSVIYGDMKPSNILLKSDGKVVLIDFGTATIQNGYNSKQNAVFGTRGYAAPEQLNPSVKIDKRVDIYSLGITLFYLLTGEDPCLPGYKSGLVRIKNPPFPKKFKKIISKCTNQNRNKRYKNCKELHDALVSCKRSKISIGTVFAIILVLCFISASFFIINNSPCGNLSAVKGRTILKKYPRITDNYKVLCKAYSVCIYDNAKALDRLEENAEKGLESLAVCEKDKQQYIVTFNNYLSLINEKRGDEAEEKKVAFAYYETALANCDDVIKAVLDDKRDSYDNIKRGTVLETKYCQKASLLTKLKQYDEAILIYQEVVDKYKTASVEAYVGYLKLLIMANEERDVGMRDYALLTEIYERGEAVEDIKEDYRWRRLTQKLKILQEEKEEEGQ
jgi:serine/threonine protein kinase